jgi:hypothetical protein
MTFASASAATAEPLKLRHTVYLGGLYMGGISTEIEQTDARYLIRTDVTSNKSMDWMFKWTAKGISQGAYAKSKFEPSLHSHVSQWRDKKRGADLSFTDNGDVKTALVGKNYSNLDKYTPVDPKSLKGSLDPLSMVLAAVNQFEMNGKCDATYPVYDGRRRYDVKLSDGGLRDFKKSAYSVFAGQAYGCRFDVTEKGGFRREKSYEIEDPSDLVVWVARPAADARPVPVRMEVKTSFGILKLHLDAYKSGDLKLASKNSQ